MAKATIFRSRLSRLCSLANSSGSHFRTDFTETYDERGVYKVIKSGKSDFNSYIQSFFSDCDIYSILSRLLMPDDNIADVKKALDSFLALKGQGVDPQYADISFMPDNIHEAKKSYDSLLSLFNSLPGSVKAEYHNSVNEFAANFGSFVSKFKEPVSVNTAAESEVKENG